MKKILVFGTFDGLHSGHFNLFKQDRKYGNYLVVVVARDKTVKKIKKYLPSKNEGERLKDLQRYNLIDETKLGENKNPYKIIEKIKPDIICLGYDQTHFTNDLSKKLKKIKLKTQIFRLRPYKPKKYHSSIINKRKYA